MFEPISGLFEGERVPIGEGDIHHLIQQFLRDTLGEGAYCQPVVRGRAVVQATTPAIAQALRLLEYDIKKTVREQTGFEVKEIVVV